MVVVVVVVLAGCCNQLRTDIALGALFVGGMKVGVLFADSTVDVMVALFAGGTIEVGVLFADGNVVVLGTLSAAGILERGVHMADGYVEELVVLLVAGMVDVVGTGNVIEQLADADTVEMDARQTMDMETVAAAQVVDVDVRYEHLDRDILFADGNVTELLVDSDTVEMDMETLVVDGC